MASVAVTNNLWYGGPAPLDAKTNFPNLPTALKELIEECDRYVGLKFTVKDGSIGRDGIPLNGREEGMPLEYWFKEGIKDEHCVIYTPQELPELFGDTLKAEKNPVYNALLKQGDGEDIKYVSSSIPMTINQYADRQPRAFCHPKFIFDKVEFDENKQDKDGTYYVLDKVARGVTL